MNLLAQQFGDLSAAVAGWARVERQACLDEAVRTIWREGWSTTRGRWLRRTVRDRNIISWGFVIADVADEMARVAYQRRSRSWMGGTPWTLGA